MLKVIIPYFIILFALGLNTSQASPLPPSPEPNLQLGSYKQLDELSDALMPLHFHFQQASVLRLVPPSADMLNQHYRSSQPIRSLYPVLRQR